MPLCPAFAASCNGCQFPSHTISAFALISSLTHSTWLNIVAQCRPPLPYLSRLFSSAPCWIRSFNASKLPAAEAI